jgi:hypothetical protein
VDSDMGVYLETYVLLGDPAQRLGVPTAVFLPVVIKGD